MRPTAKPDRRQVLTGIAVFLQLGIVGLLYLVLHETSEGTAIRQFVVALVSAVLGLLGAMIFRWSTEREDYRRGAYTERAKAVQAIMHSVRNYKDIGAWKAPAEAGKVERVNMSRRKYLDDAGGQLLRDAFQYDVWIGERGVQAVRNFLDEARFESLADLGSRDARVDLLNAAQLRLRNALYHDLGFEAQ